MTSHTKHTAARTVTIQPPNEKQRQFLTCTKKYIAFGGARGGGKSWAVRTKAKLLALRYGGIRLLILRRTLPELESNHVRFLRSELAGVAVYNAAARQFSFPNGSVIDFGYCASDGDLDRYQGAEYDVIFLDEATQLKEDWMRRLGSRMKLWHVTDRGCRQHGPAMTPILKSDSMELGTGNMNLEGLLAIARENGVEKVVLESHKNWIGKDPVKSLELSARWLNERKA